MEARKRLDGLDLDDHRTSNEKVEAIGALQAQTLIDNRQRQLSLDQQATPLQLVSQAVLVGSLEKAGSERAMDLQARVDHLARDAVCGLIHVFVSFASLVLFVSPLGRGTTAIS